MTNKYEPLKEKIMSEPEEKEGYIRDYITGEWIKDKPENREAKVVFEERLVEEYNYSKKEILPEFYITKGSAKIGPADIVVFHNEKTKTQDNIFLVIECKRKERRDGLQQLKTYLAPCVAAKYGVWFNGKEIVYLRKLDKPPHFKEIPNIPKKGETLGLPRKKDLTPATELKSIFETCHNHIYANDGLLKEKVFNEVLKVIFLKMIDEKAIDPMAKFGITEEEYDEVKEGKRNAFLTRMEELFTKVKKKYGDVFTPDERINLQPATLAFVVGQLQYMDLRHTSADVKGTAFQTFVYAHQRGERGEYFTPDPIVTLMVNILNPGIDEMVLDPACGSAGFLVAAMKHVWRKLAEKIDNPTEFREAQWDYANACIRGIDFNPDLARVSKMRMVLEDDGHTGIFSVNALETFDQIQESARRAGATKIKKGVFDIVLTNPPFGSKGKVTSKEILQHFDLGYKWREDKENKTFIKTNTLMDGQVPDILFIERCLDFLAYYGRMGIVLPNGTLNNSTLEYVREYIKRYARILAVVSLPVGTFISAGANPQPSVLFLQKLSRKEAEELNKKDYPIFMAIVEKIGYDLTTKTAPPIYI